MCMWLKHLVNVTALRALKLFNGCERKLGVEYSQICDKSDMINHFIGCKIA